MISLRGVSKHYPGATAPAVDALDLEVREGELLVLLGESGCGKTTTLKMINRLVEPGAGVITVAGENINAIDPVMLRRRIGYVFQGIGLFPHLTVARNVALVPELLGTPETESNARVTELLELVGLPESEFSGRFPAELSGGQQQRVGVARALAARPKVLLMDEPFGALDPLTRAELQTELKALQASFGLTILLVTHDMTEAVLLGDRIAVMRAGRIIGLGTPAELMRHPPDDYVARLMAMPRQQADAVERIATESDREAS